MRAFSVVSAMLLVAGISLAQPPIPPPAPNGPVFQPYVPPTGGAVATPAAIQQSLRANQALYFYAGFADSYHQRYMAPFLTMIGQRPGYLDEYYRKYFAPFQPMSWSMPEEPVATITADGPVATRIEQAQVTLEVPAHAQVWVEGKKQEFRGTAVRIVSPDLEPGRRYAYTVLVRWPSGKSEVERHFEMPVAAGDRKVLSVVGASK